MKLQKGYLLVQILVFGAMAIVMITGLVSFAAANIKLGNRLVLSEQAFQMAEAGLEYYRCTWLTTLPTIPMTPVFPVRM